MGFLTNRRDRQQRCKRTGAVVRGMGLSIAVTLRSTFLTVRGILADGAGQADLLQSTADLGSGPFGRFLT